MSAIIDLNSFMCIKTGSRNPLNAQLIIYNIVCVGDLCCYIKHFSSFFCTNKQYDME